MSSCKYGISVIKWRRMRWMGHVSFIAEMGSVLSTMVRKPEENMPLGRHRLR